MNLSIEKDKMEEWKMEILSFKKAYPYFVIPQVIESIQNQNAITSKLVYFFNLNQTVIATNDFSLVRSTLPKEIINTTIDSKPLNIKEEHITSTSSDIIASPSGADYYSAQGVKISNDMPDKGSLDTFHAKRSHASDIQEKEEEDIEQALLVQMSFSDWLVHITNSKRKEREDLEEQAHLKNKWKKQKLTDAIQEENDEIPEQVFQMAVDSIEREDSLVSESLAEVYRLQGKYEQSINMYRKLILLNPKKRVYFADKIDQIQKNT